MPPEGGVQAVTTKWFPLLESAKHPTQPHLVRRDPYSSTSLKLDQAQDSHTSESPCSVLIISAMPTYVFLLLGVEHLEISQCTLYFLIFFMQREAV